MATTRQQEGSGSPDERLAQDEAEAVGYTRQELHVALMRGRVRPLRSRESMGDGAKGTVDGTELTIRDIEGAAYRKMTATLFAQGRLGGRGSRPNTTPQ